MTCWHDDSSCARGLPHAAQTNGNVVVEIAQRPTRASISERGDECVSKYRAGCMSSPGHAKRHGCGGGSSGPDRPTIDGMEGLARICAKMQRDHVPGASPGGAGHAGQDARGERPPSGGAHGRARPPDGPQHPGQTRQEQLPPEHGIRVHLWVAVRARQGGLRALLARAGALPVRPRGGPPLRHLAPLVHHQRRLPPGLLVHEPVPHVHAVRAVRGHLRRLLPGRPFRGGPGRL
mmetsp:Transcript_11215/g.26355  ORF Transcript_11215/g.26355 Transcript_11215/m.26355 type:complete len:234 (+) Transcript_11215:113-814(+)